MESIFSGAGNGVSVELIDSFIAWFKDGCKQAELLAEQLLYFNTNSAEI